ncbi:right-handed parallel beta-helix repeat-containing protein [uncultured Draconibacterium sp.]|uniref:right-handed parallel beta-helix repeat-containing protein n=1 Tax=uncultured Draconibacterium sp. TaxID=1573823 RepID=UPI003217E926
MKKKIIIFSILVSTLIFLLISCNTESGYKSTEYFVSKSGSDTNEGSSGSPFLTINKAAELAMPGDIITVSEGVYRERVNPPRGGNSENDRITYRTAKGDDVRIVGSEIASGWVKQENGLWSISLKKDFFGDFNPFNTLVKHPAIIRGDGDGWGWLRYGRHAHLGDVYINGKGLTEKQSNASLVDTVLTWHAEVDTISGITTILANFGNNTPMASNVEVNVRPFAFFPEKPGTNYITLQGFTIMNVACHWAPPSVFQPGAIVTNGGKGWIIEDNIILYAKTAGISLGIPSESYPVNASGHHIIRNNVIMRCGQAGIVGHRYNYKSLIEGNHIEDISYREEFGGAETAGIKFHMGDSVTIRNNFIRGVYTATDEDPNIGAAHGIWGDVNNTNWRVSNNIISACEGFPILSEANVAGPNLYENNVLIGGGGPMWIFSSIGEAWVHNLFINTGFALENQPRRREINDHRWINNIFVQKGLDFDFKMDTLIDHGNVYLNYANPTGFMDKGLIIKDPQEISIVNTPGEYILNINYSKNIFDANFDLATDSIIGFKYSFDGSVLKDFYGNSRNAGVVIPGPFQEVKDGMNRFVLYKYPDLYSKAQEILSKNTLYY